MNGRMSIADEYRAEQARAERAATLDVMASLLSWDGDVSDDGMGTELLGSPDSAFVSVSVRDDAGRSYNLARLSGRVIA